MIKSTTSIISCFETLLKSKETSQYLIEMIELSGTIKSRFRIKIIELLQLFEVNFNSFDQSELKGVSARFIESLDALKNNKI